jgi:hypothetical protein
VSLSLTIEPCAPPYGPWQERLGERRGSGMLHPCGDAGTRQVIRNDFRVGCPLILATSEAAGSIDVDGPGFSPGLCHCHRSQGVTVEKVIGQTCDFVFMKVWVYQTWIYTPVTRHCHRSQNPTHPLAPSRLQRWGHFCLKCLECLEDRASANRLRKEVC